MQANGLAPTSLRPRNKRLISGLEDWDDDAAPTAAQTSNASTALASPYLTPFGGSPVNSRAPSPIPSKHPSRSSTPARKPATNRNSYAGGNTNASPRGKDDLLAPDHANDLAASLSGLWGRSWTSLQGLASNVLGSDASTQELFKDKAPPRTRRPYEATHTKNNGRTSPGSWGPRSRDTSLPGGGTGEERQAMLRAKRRQELLAGSPPTLGAQAVKVKRRMSDDFESMSAPPGEHDDRDVVVYVHHVSKDDTLAGIAIKYNCQMAVVKRANRLWSNDGVQARRHLMLPVDVCGIRGRPMPGPDMDKPDDDLLGDDQKTPTPMQGPWAPQRSNSSSTVRQAVQHVRHGSSQSAGSQQQEELWRHDSWVLLEGFERPTEIARVSRREMGYFPRGRRKSVAYSDLDTPSASLDLHRASVTIAEEPNAAAAAAAGGGGGGSSSSSGSKTRARRSSSAGQWAQQMQGPGGVGKLGGKGVSVPGPSQDKLNKVFGKHLTSMAPLGTPANGSSEELVDGATQFSQTVQHVGGAIEGWVRTLAKNAARVVEPAAGDQQRRRQQQQQLGMPSGARGDLIELSTAFELGGDEDEDEDDDAGEAAHRGSDESTELHRGRSTGREAGTLLARSSHDTSKSKGE